MFSYVHDAFQHSPILLLRSAVKRCGKTTLVALLQELVHRPLAASNLTAAVVFRVIEAHRPTLLIDEVDSFLEVNEELRGVLNSGHTRATALVFRVEEIGGKRETVGFSTWAPKLLAMIGQPPSTLLDRAISITMQRKHRGDKVEKRRHAALDVDVLRAKCMRWAQDHSVALSEARPAIPDALNDRQGDSWEPLLAIAERAGRQAAEKASAAALSLCAAGAGDLDEGELGEQLLRDIREIFNARAHRRLMDVNVKDTYRISSEELVQALLALDGRPWTECHRGKEITQVWLARRLSPFGIQSRSVRMTDGRTPKGYLCELFEETWERYTPVASATPP